MFFSIQKTENDWQFKANTKYGCKSYKDGCLWPRGKMLSGTHGMNAMVYLRGNRLDYDNWKHSGNTDWGYEDVLKYFKKSERNLDIEFINYQNGKYHSDDGLLPVAKYRSKKVELPTENYFISAGREAGYEYVSDFNSDTMLGYSRVQGTIFDGRRQTTAKTFLIPANDRPNLHVIKYAHVTKIEINENDEATAVNFIYNKMYNWTVSSNKEIILSSGAISTPQLLQLSGIGRKKYLKQFGITMKKELAVGENLQDHLIIPMFFSFHRSNVDRLRTDDILGEMLDLYLRNNGSFTTLGITDLVGYINTVNGEGYPDIELHHFAYSKESVALKMYLDKVGFGQEIQNTLIEESMKSVLAMVFVVLLNPKSTGSVKLKSNDPLEKPLIFANYLNEIEDWETIIKGVKYQYDQIFSRVFKENDGLFVRLPLKDCDEMKFASDKYFKCYIDQMATTIYHPVGTARMGPKNNKTTVVDSRLRVHGIRNLRVVDASMYVPLFLLFAHSIIIKRLIRSYQFSECQRFLVQILMPLQ